MDDAATTRLLVWDEPDMEGALASVLVTEPDTPAGVDLAAVYLWLADRCEEGEVANAQLFADVVPGTEATVSEHITAVRTCGFGVVARPSRSTSPSLSGTLVTHLEGAAARGDLAEVLVASHDGAGLRAALEALAESGVAVTVLGFRERAGYAADSGTLAFFDLEEVAGAFAAPLPRTNLYDLPEEGLALPPLRRPDRAGTTGAAPAATGPGIGSATPAGPTWAAGRAPAGLGVGGGSTGRAASGDPALAAVGGDTSSGPDIDLRSEAVGTTGAATVEPPPSGPSTAGALDDLLAGVQATPLASNPPANRPGRVSPPNGELGPAATGSAATASSTTDVAGAEDPTGDG